LNLNTLSLSNLFNVLPRRSPLRLPVYQSLLQLAASQDEIDLLGINLPDVQRWLGEWNVNAEDKSALLKNIAKVLGEADHS
jgi:translation initiation factor 3 subunit M